MPPLNRPGRRPKVRGEFLHHRQQFRIPQPRVADAVNRAGLGSCREDLQGPVRTGQRLPDRPARRLGREPIDRVLADVAQAAKLGKRPVVELQFRSVTSGTERHVTGGDEILGFLPQVFRLFPHLPAVAGQCGDRLEGLIRASAKQFLVREIEIRHRWAPLAKGKEKHTQNRRDGRTVSRLAGFARFPKRGNAQQAKCSRRPNPKANLVCTTGLRLPVLAKGQVRQGRRCLSLLPGERSFSRQP